MKIKIIKINYDDTHINIVFDSKQVLYMNYKDDSFLEIYLPYQTRIIVDEKSYIFVIDEKKESRSIKYNQLYEAYYRE